jgi:hypothetical protein
MRLPTQRKRRTLQEIDAVAERYRQSGLTQKTFATEEGICVATLAKYLRVAAERKHTGNPIWDWRAAGTKVAGCLTRLF